MRALPASVEREEQLALARSVVFSVGFTYWRELESRCGTRWPLCPLPPRIDRLPLSVEAEQLAQRFGTRAATLDVLEGNLWSDIVRENLIEH